MVLCRRRRIGSVREEHHLDGSLTAWADGSIDSTAELRPWIAGEQCDVAVDKDLNNSGARPELLANVGQDGRIHQSGREFLSKKYSQKFGRVGAEPLGSGKCR